MNVHQPDSTRLDLWLDGRLAGAEREAFERELERDPELSLELERQRALDAALGRLFTPPDLGRVAARIAARSAAPAPLQRFQPFLSLAAAVLVYLAAGWWIFAVVEERPAPERADWTGAYSLGCSGWVAPVVESCTSVTDILRASEERFELPLPMREDPSVTFRGEAPGGRLGGALGLIATCEGREVLVAISPLADDPHPTVDPASGIRLFRATAGEYVIYELTPLGEPRVLPLFSSPAR